MRKSQFDRRSPDNTNVRLTAVQKNITLQHTGIRYTALLQFCLGCRQNVGQSTDKGQ